MSKTLVITKKAEADLEAIWIYSLEQFGEDQADRYLLQLDRSIRETLKMPESGRQCDELASGLRCKAVQSHMHYYTVTDMAVEIRRNLHGSMNAALYLKA